MEWVEKDTIREFPWDLTPTIKDRILVEHGSLVDIRHRGNRWDIMDWEEAFKDVPEDISLSDLIRKFPQELSKKVIQKHLKRLWLAKILNQEKWEELFRYEMEWRDSSYETFVEKMEAEQAEEEKKVQEAKHFLKISKTLESTKPYPILGWKPGRHKSRYHIQDDRTLGRIFHDTVLSKTETWLLAIWKTETQVLSKINRVNDPSLLDILKEQEGRFQDLEEGIYLFSDKIVPVHLVQKDEQLILEVEFEESDFLEDTLSCFQMEKEQILEKKDIGLIGQFVFPDLFLEFPLFQDACLNDPVFSTFFYVDESRRSSFEATLWISFTDYFRSVLGVEKYPSDFYMKNIHRQAGFLNTVQITTPIPEQKIDLFLDITSRLMERFLANLQPPLSAEYQRLIPSEIPSIFDKQKKALIKNIKKDRPDYFLKYPRMFVTNLYTVKCQKKFQPELISEEEAQGLNESRYIRFPPEKMAEFEPEYYYCPSEKAPYAGLKDMKGSNAHINFVPCCFKSPQDALNVENLKKVKLLGGEEEKTVEAEKKVKKDYIIERNLIIKNPGQLGRVNPESMKRFLLAYDPFSEYFRIGIEQDQNALLHCLITMRKSMGYEQLQDVEKIREEMAGNPEIIKACIQDNPGLSPEQIQKDLADTSIYLDPRRFLNAVETYFNVRLILFTKKVKEKDDASLLRPVSMRSHVSNVSEPPYVMIFEHFGGKTDILTDTKHPHCELITYRSFGEDRLQFEFKANTAMEVLENLTFQFDGTCPVYPFDQKKARKIIDSLVGQSLDGMGKVRMLHFRYNGILLSATVDPMAIQPSVPVLPPRQNEMDAVDALPFLVQFQTWKQLIVPNPKDTLLYWTVAEPSLFWKNIHQNTEIRLTFKIRIPSVRSTQIEKASMVKNSRIRISPDYGLRLEVDEEDWLTPEVYNEKRARCLAHLARYLFSGFLAEHSIPNKAFDPDTILEKFQKMHVLLEDDKMPYSEMNRLRNFIRRDRIKIPSLAVWNKISFSLRWQMFYNFSQLLEFGKENPEDVFFQTLSDFRYSDVHHFYCDFNQLKSVLENSIEEKYEISTARLEDISSAGFWYNPSQSPYPFPSLVKMFPTEEQALEVASFYLEKGYFPSEEDNTAVSWDDSYMHFGWEEDKWVYKGGEGGEKIFTLKRERDVLVLFKK